MPSLAPPGQPSVSSVLLDYPQFFGRAHNVGINRAAFKKAQTKTHTHTRWSHTKKVQPGLTFTATHKTTSSVHIPGGLLSKPSETIKTTSTVITENPFSYATVCFGISTMCLGLRFTVSTCFPAWMSTIVSNQKKKEKMLGDLTPA